jgi:hypothetical protein
MKLTVELTDQELGALQLLARGRQLKIVAGVLPSEPDDRAIAKVLLAGAAATGEGGA